MWFRSSLLFVLSSVSFAAAHEGHVHAEVPTDGSGDVGGIITVTEQGRRNLGIEVVEADIAELEKTLEVVAEVVPMPTRTAVLSSRIPGRVKRIDAISGQKVRSGQALVTIESFQPGNPPPTVSYSSPIDGTITHWDAEVGESVEPNGHLAEIIDLSQVYVQLTLFEGQVRQVEYGQPVRIYIESYPDEVFAGTIDLMSGKLDPETRTLKAFATVNNPNLTLRPHMRGSAHIVTESLDAVIAVPHRAITGDPANLFAFVQTDEDGLEYEQRSVVIGSRDDRVTEVIEGVLPGELVVTSGNYQLQFVERKAAPAEESHDGHAHDHSHGHEHEAHQHHHHSHSPFSYPLVWVLIAGLLVSLVANGLYAAKLNQKTQG